MSLLMDALKRAEKARQAQATARPEDGSDDPEVTQGLSLDPIAEPAPAAEGPAPGSGDAAPRSEPGAESGEMSLSLDDPVFDDLVERAPPREPDDLESFSLVEDEVPVDDTSATLPSAKAAQESVQDYFDGSQSVSVSMRKVREAIDDEPAADPNADTAERLREATDRRAAQSVFDAKRPRRRSGAWFGATFAVLLLALLGAGGYFYFDELMKLVVGTPPVTARRVPVPVESPAPSAPRVAEAPAEATTPAVASMPTAPAPAATAEPVVVVAAPEPLPAPPEPAAAPSAEPAAPSVDELLAAIQGQVTADQPPSAPAPAAEVASPAAAMAADPNAPALAALPAGLRALAEGGPSALTGELTVPAEIRITRRRVPERVHPLLSAGYTAFQAGDNAAAAESYRAVLAREPRNRDAMLGLAAVATRRGEHEQALETYLRLLSLNPRDSVAQAAVMALGGNMDPVAGETQVKNLLVRDPEQPFLHFTLGNLYAQQGRWAQAQETYFEAYRRDNDNPDYAYNLAVSLDRLVQPATARNYYARALDLSDRRVALFDVQAVLSRIQSIDAAAAR